MLNLTTSTAQDFADFARQLWLEKDNFTSHEAASQAIVKRLFETCVAADGSAQLALVRIFRLTNVVDLPPDVHAMVGADEVRVMALTGTWGIETAWQHRSRSQGHQAIPISAIAVPEKIPMFQTVLTQMGIDIDHFYATAEIVTRSDTPYGGTFYIPDANGPEIPAQKEFVEPYGIKSLVGFGGFIDTTDTMYLLYAFSRVPIIAEIAQAFWRMSDFIGTAIAVEGAIFGD